VVDKVQNLMRSASNAKHPFALEAYERHQSEVSLHMSHFFVSYLREIYRHFEGDLALVIVLGEIAHHNLSAHFTAEVGGNRESLARLAREDGLQRQMPGCNAYSLAAATGLPRETIRRKIARLETLGWVERASRKEVRITPQVSEHFQPDFNVNLLAALLNTAERLRALLAT
jgi:hypothetical protein